MFKNVSPPSVLYVAPVPPLPPPSPVLADPFPALTVAVLIKYDLDALPPAGTNTVYEFPGVTAMLFL
jgi:hypothetical protein